MSKKLLSNITVNGNETLYIYDEDAAHDASYIHTDNNYTTAEKNKLSGIAAGAEVNVQSNWNETDSTSDSYIQNKPDVPVPVYEDFTIATLDWEVNYNPASSATYPYICHKVLTDDVPVHASWRTTSTSNTVPTSAEIDEMALVVEAYFGTGDKYYTNSSTYTDTTSKTIMIYATDELTSNLKFMYKGLE